MILGRKLKTPHNHCVPANDGKESQTLNGHKAHSIVTVLHTIHDLLFPTSKLHGGSCSEVREHRSNFSTLLGSYYPITIVIPLSKWLSLYQGLKADLELFTTDPRTLDREIRQSCL
jgi:hypothetical protein